MRTQSSTSPASIASVFLLAIFAYVAAYLALVQPQGRIIVGPSGFRETSYRVDNPACEFFFWPLEKVHCWLLPGDWERYRSLSEIGGGISFDNLTAGVSEAVCFSTSQNSTRAMRTGAVT